MADITAVKLAVETLSIGFGILSLCFGLMCLALTASGH